jgi:hypothetical protein
MPSALSVLQDHTVLQCRSLDRLYLNAYIPELQRPPLVKRFLEREATPIASPALFQARSDAFVKDLRAYAQAHGAPWIVFERGERKEDRMRPLSEAAEQRLLPGLVAVGVAQERTTGWKGTKQALDRAAGRSASPGSASTSTSTTAICGTPTGARRSSISAAMRRGAAGSGSTATTGRSAQLAKRGVGHVSLDNGFRQVDDPALLDELTGSLGADEIRAYFARWIAQLPQPLTDDDRVAGYGYALSMLQVEVSDTRMFDRPIRARQWFEATITEQLTLGRPEKVSLDRPTTRPPSVGCCNRGGGRRRPSDPRCARCSRYDLSRLPS